MNILVVKFPPEFVTSTSYPKEGTMKLFWRRKASRETTK
jgi:hypothetical protein